MRNLYSAALWAAAIALNIGATAPYVSPKPPNTLTKSEEYIIRFKDLAMFEQLTTNIPASIKLGQALLESQAGESELAMNANNHFGLKCKTCSANDAYLKTDDEYNRKGQLIYSKFYRFDNAEASFSAHSYRLTTEPRYRRLFNNDRTDYRAWAYGLKACGYATDRNYAEKLIDIIEKYNLQRFDKPSLLSLSELAQNPPPQYSDDNFSVNLPYDSDPNVAKPQYYQRDNAQIEAEEARKRRKMRETSSENVDNAYRTESSFRTQEGEQMHFTLYEVTLEGENVNVSPKSAPKKQVKPMQRKKNARSPK
jgi:hypothetical protein